MEGRHAARGAKHATAAARDRRRCAAETGRSACLISRRHASAACESGPSSSCGIAMCCTGSWPTEALGPLSIRQTPRGP
eukprot:8852789-Lingulodinium_polyedra.AAC.1